MKIRSRRLLFVILACGLTWIHVPALMADPPPLYINEFMADNDTVIEDPDQPGAYEDWFEIFNAGATVVDLGGMYLTDDLADPTQYQIPAGVTIPAGGYLIFWADDDDGQGDTHTNFKLSADGEEIGLYDTDENGNVAINVLSYSAQMTDISFGRCPDGSDTWAIYTIPTPGAANGSSPSTVAWLVIGPGPSEANPTLVSIFDSANPSSGFLAQWHAYGVDRFGVNVTTGDLDGDGIDSVITGAGPGAVFGPHVRAFDVTGIPLAGINFLAYGTNKYGVNVACGDVDGDGFDEIVTGAGPGAVFGPHVRGWNVDGTPGVDPIPGISYFAYGTPKWGVNVTAGDIDGDGFDEIVTGAGPGAVYGPHVRGWNVDGSAATAIPGVSYFAYGTLKFGVNVACGDLDGDGIDEIITGAGPGSVFGSHVRGWSFDGTTASSVSGVNLFVYSDLNAIYGVVVAAADVDGDEIDEILTMPGPGPALPARARAWNVDGGAAVLIPGIDFDAYSETGLMYGGKICGGSF